MPSRSLLLVSVLLWKCIGRTHGILHRVDLPAAVEAHKAPLCLDGTPYAYGYRKGQGSGRAKWIIHLQGGAWCATEQECFSRRGTSMGTSGGWAYFQEPAGVLSDEPELNPDMHNWNAVFLPYCDGSSFLSDRSAPVIVNGTEVYMRGAWIFHSVILHLLSRQGLSDAEARVMSSSIRTMCASEWTHAFDACPHSRAHASARARQHTRLIPYSREAAN